jgi:Protein of unknown function (DUF3237)
MAEHLPGELIYTYDLQVTGVTSHGAPAFDAVVSGAAGIPPPGARYDFALEGPIVGRRLRGMVSGVDYIYVRPDGRVQLDIHAVITTEDGKKIAFHAGGAARFTAGSPVADLRENVTLTTCEPDYAWVNLLEIWAVGTVDIATGQVHIAGYAV